MISVAPRSCITFPLTLSPFLSISPEISSSSAAAVSLASSLSLYQSPLIPLSLALPSLSSIPILTPRAHLLYASHPEPPSFARAASLALVLLFCRSFFSLFPWLTHFRSVTSATSPFLRCLFLTTFFVSLPQFFFLSLSRSCSLLHVFSLTYPPFFMFSVFFLFPFSVFRFVLSHHRTFSLSNFFPSLTNFFPITSLIITVIARYLSNISRISLSPSLAFPLSLCIFLISLFPTLYPFFIFIYFVTPLHLFPLKKTPLSSSLFSPFQSPFYYFSLPIAQRLISFSLSFSPLTSFLST